MTVSQRAGDAFGLSVQGPVARTVADAAAYLDALAGPEPGDPYVAPEEYDTPQEYEQSHRPAALTH